MSSVFLSIGMTVATLAISGNLDEARMLLISVANGVDRKFDANLASFVGTYPYQTPFYIERLLN